MTEPSALVKDLEVSTFLPTIEDCMKVNTEFIVLTAGVLTDCLAAWKCLQESLPAHIRYKFLKEMAMKSDIVCTHMHYIVIGIFG